jgi:nucleoside-diphosphate-sugar epimerase
MTILITGIRGFIGENLVSMLKKNYSICGISTTSSEQEDIHIYSWDEFNSLPDIDVVVHLAGKAHDTKNQTERQAYFDINTGLTQKIFDWFLQSSAEKFIFFSSVKAVTDTTEDILTEDVIPIPKGPYGESKCAAEKYIKTAYTNSGIQTKKIYILRPCMIHGAGNKGNLNLLYNIIRKGVPWPLGAFDNRRSFVAIDNLIFIINKLIEQDISDGIYNIADDEALSTNEVIQIMCESMPCKCKILPISKNLMTGMAIVGSILHLPLNRERLKKLTENYIVSNEKIKKALDITNLPVSAREGLAKTINSFQQRNIQP